MGGARSFHETARRRPQRKSVRGCRWLFQADCKAEDCGCWKDFATTRPAREQRRRLREPTASPSWLSKRLEFARLCSFRRPSWPVPNALSLRAIAFRETSSFEALPQKPTPLQVARKRKWPGTASVPSHFSLSECHAAICLEIGTTLISTLRGIAAAATGALISSIPL